MYFLRTVETIACAGILAGLMTAQTPASSAFEVASVKQNRSDSANAQITMLGTRFEATGVPLRGLIALAYGEPGPPPRTRPNDVIVGGPNWLNTDLFDVAAEAGANVPPGPASVGQKLQMLRVLLEERFSLAVHHENREAPAYALVLARSDRRLGPQLRRSDIDCRALLTARGGSPAPVASPGDRPLCRAAVGAGGSLTGGALTMSDLASTLARMTNRLVTDRTGLAGSFDVDLQFNPEGLAGMTPLGLDRAAPVDDKPSIFTAVQEQLGLKLESTRGLVDVLVIDSAEHPRPD